MGVWVPVLESQWEPVGEGGRCRGPAYGDGGLPSGSVFWAQEPVVPVLAEASGLRGLVARCSFSTMLWTREEPFPAGTVCVPEHILFRAGVDLSSGAQGWQ